MKVGNIDEMHGLEQPVSTCHESYSPDVTLFDPVRSVVRSP